MENPNNGKHISLTAVGAVKMQFWGDVVLISNSRMVMAIGGREKERHGGSALILKWSSLIFNIS